MKTKIILFIFISMLFSCSVWNIGTTRNDRKKLKAQEKILKLADKYNLTSIDSVTIKDTIYISSVKKDTIFSFESITQPFVIEKENLRIKVERIRDSIYLSGECLGDTIYLEKTIPINQIVIKGSKVALWNFWKWIRRNLFFLVLILSMFFLVRFILNNLTNIQTFGLWQTIKNVLIGKIKK